MFHDSGGGPTHEIRCTSQGQVGTPLLGPRRVSTRVSGRETAISTLVTRIARSRAPMTETTPYVDRDSVAEGVDAV